MAISILPIGHRLLAEAEVLGGGEELSRGERERARRAAENLARRGEDQEKLNDLALRGFTGPEYEIFVGELAAYAYPVLLAWLRRAVIFKYCADRGRPVKPTDADRDVLASSFNERLQLSLETVAEALTFFRRYVLYGRRWSYDGGASVTTYFIGSCLFAFPNVFRRWQGEQRRWRQATAVEMLNCPEGRGRTLADQPGTDPADRVVGRASVVDALNAMPPATRAAAALVIDGQSFAKPPSTWARQSVVSRASCTGTAPRVASTSGKEDPVSEHNPQEIIDIITLDRITEVLQLRNAADPDDARSDVIGDLHRIRNMLENVEVTYLQGEAARAVVTRTLRLLAELGDLEKTSLGTANARRIRSHATAGRVADILARHLASARHGGRDPWRRQTVGGHGYRCPDEEGPVPMGLSTGDRTALLSQWIKPSSDDEQNQQARAERMVREAIAAHAAFDDSNVRIYTKGSYPNNTNVRRDSDVDVAVEPQDCVYYDYLPGVTAPASSKPGPYSGSWTPGEVARRGESRPHQPLRQRRGSTPAGGSRSTSVRLLGAAPAPTLFRASRTSGATTATRPSCTWVCASSRPAAERRSSTGHSSS